MRFFESDLTAFFGRAFASRGRAPRENACDGYQASRRAGVSLSRSIAAGRNARSIVERLEQSR
jgi:hypothetical protein